ncbi:hypothetical protein GA0115240_123633 [Streptomyces sp. DvalAA-14]|uniref:hypothetical protein n=1 Tax=unclassified Streptomyces TaxID=2593676 RepID=UPI00081AF4DA|nr:MULTISPECIES: hypothetical protein [unclassified Streptomyces]MYS20823.1 hypothetical protein [Streptomyces sp. SID4948]SCD78002.1 hypothetical protein GA0115240_123633 [Streptomyces sp. DvalAA-14]
MAYELNSLLGRLVGFRLYSVQFVMDYVQLRFDGPTNETPVLTCDVLPTLTLAGQSLSPTEAGWAGALRGFIPQNVISTHEKTGIGIKVDFDTGSIQLHPTKGELIGPEIAMLNGFEDRSWMVWRPGEDAFEDL